MSFLIIAGITITGCSIPMAQKYTQLEFANAYKKGKKIQLDIEKPGLDIRDFLGYEMKKDDISSAKEKVETYIAEHADIEESNKAHLQELCVAVGATSGEVELLLGKPEKIMKKRNTKHPISEVWIYRTNKPQLFSIVIVPILLVRQGYYLYFKDGILKNIERHYLHQIVAMDAS